MENFSNNQENDPNEKPIHLMSNITDSEAQINNALTREAWIERYDEIIFIFIGIVISLISEVAAEIFGAVGTLLVAFLLLISIIIFVVYKMNSLS